MHIEVDEPRHKAFVSDDAMREIDIVNATNHKIFHIDVSKSIDEINERIESILQEITISLKFIKANGTFAPWNIDMEYDPETYINLGYIDIKDNVAFRTIKDACNCFGHNYASYRKGGAPHPYLENVMLWYPKLYPNDGWDNQISLDENTIVESCLDEEKSKDNIKRVMRNDNWQGSHIRIVFAKVKDNLGDTLYRFKGQYELCVNESIYSLVWKRTNTKVKTYQRKT